VCECECGRAGDLRGRFGAGKGFRECVEIEPLDIGFDLGLVPVGKPFVENGDGQSLRLGDLFHRAEQHHPIVLRNFRIMLLRIRGTGQNLAEGAGVHSLETHGLQRGDELSRDFLERRQRFGFRPPLQELLQGERRFLGRSVVNGGLQFRRKRFEHGLLDKLSAGLMRQDRVEGRDGRENHGLRDAPDALYDLPNRKGDDAVSFGEISVNVEIETQRIGGQDFAVPREELAGDRQLVRRIGKIAFDRVAEFVDFVECDFPAFRVGFGRFGRFDGFRVGRCRRCRLWRGLWQISLVCGFHFHAPELGLRLQVWAGAAPMLLNIGVFGVRVNQNLGRQGVFVGGLTWRAEGLRFGVKGFFVEGELN